MTDQPVKLNKGDVIYIRMVEDEEALTRMKVTLGDGGIHLDNDPFMYGEKHFFTLFDLYTLFLMEHPLSIKIPVNGPLTTIFHITKVDMVSNTIEILPTKGFEIFIPKISI